MRWGEDTGREVCLRWGEDTGRGREVSEAGLWSRSENTGKGGKGIRELMN